MSPSEQAEREWHRKIIEENLHLLDDPRTYRVVCIHDEDDPRLSELFREGKIKLTLADLLDEDGNYVDPSVEELLASQVG